MDKWEQLQWKPCCYYGVGGVESEKHVQYAVLLYVQEQRLNRFITSLVHVGSFDVEWNELKLQMWEGFTDQIV